MGDDVWSARTGDFGVWRTSPGGTLAIIMLFFFFKDTATPDIYTLSLHDALPISRPYAGGMFCRFLFALLTATAAISSHAQTKFYFHDAASPNLGTLPGAGTTSAVTPSVTARSEEHTSELQSRLHLVCRLLLEKKK